MLPNSIPYWNGGFTKSNPCEKKSQIGYACEKNLKF